MSQSRRTPLRASLCGYLMVVPLVLTSGLGHPAAAQPQGFSGLLGKELSVVEDLDSALEDLLGDLLGGARGLDGELEKALVTEDRERSLTILITLSGFQAADIHGKILDSDKELVDGIPAVTVSADSTTTEVELAFQLSEQLPEGTELGSMYVKLELTRPGRRQVGRSVLYLAEKQWQVEVRPENVIVETIARPIGDSGDPALARDFQPGSPAVDSAAARPDQPRIDTDRLRPAAVPATRVTIQPARLPTSEAAAAAAADTPTVSPTVRPTVARYAIPQDAIRRAYIRPELYQLKQPGNLRIGLSQEQRDQGARGPSTMRINLLQLRHGGEALDVQELKAILGIDPFVYQDKNPSSGVFYFVPSRYSLLWNPQDGYGLNILFRTASHAGEAGEVHMAARLTAGISVSAWQLASQLLEAWAERTGGEFERLDPLPLRSSELRVSLADDLERLYDIPADEILVQSTTQLLSDFEIEWVTDDVTANDLMVALERRGITGDVEIESEGDIGRVRVPVEISVTSSAAYPPFAWERGGEWRNSTLFPLRLRYVRALLIDSSNNPAILSWDLGGATVPPQARFTIADNAILGWQETAALDTWVDYAVASDCADCAQLALDQVKDGSTELARDWISFRTLRPLADLGAYMIVAEIRSLYFQPRDREYRVLGPIELLEDDSSYDAGQLYVPPEYESGELEELFQYRLFVVMPDGTEHPESGTPQWITSGRPRVNIGPAQVRQSLGYVPGEEPPDR